MSKIVAYIHDIPIYLNGASILMRHHLHALEELGFDTELRHFKEGIPDDADWVLFQSEWYNKIKKDLDKSAAKRICWLGHFKPIQRLAMPLIGHIEADIFHTQWKGDCALYAQDEIKKDIHYLPHGGCTCMKQGVKVYNTDTLFVGTSYPERDMSWLQYSNVPVIKSKLEDVANRYYSAVVCPNLHGDFQRNKISETMQVTGEMINDRIFQIILSGGFAISDNTPIVKEFFSEDEVPYAENKEQYKKLIQYYINNPVERQSFMEKAKTRILNEHLYIHRWNKLQHLL